VILPALVLLAAGPELFYSKSFPGSVPAYVEISLKRDGAVIYKEKPDDEQPVHFTLAPAETGELFELAEKLDRFKNKLESGLNVARMGEKTFRWLEAGVTQEQKFNYSTDENARLLQDWFERITETEQHLFALERTARFDKLGVNKALLQLEASWDKKRIVAPQQFTPWLNRIANNQSFLNMDRERAAWLKELFQNPAAAPAQP
jgi:hypothetical protein